MREPMSYALLFSRGESGWGNEKKCVKLRFPAYLASRLLRMEPNFYAESLLANGYYLQSNRFQSLAHLGQMYIVDSISTMIDTQLKYTRNNQDLITGGRRNDVQNEDEGLLLYSLHYMIMFKLAVNIE
jgi:hypothetical protein